LTYYTNAQNAIQSWDMIFDARFKLDALIKIDNDAAKYRSTIDKEAHEKIGKLRYSFSDLFSDADVSDPLKREGYEAFFKKFNVRSNDKQHALEFT
jgi:hypothetical protein